MNFDYSEKSVELQKRLSAFMDKNIYPNETICEKKSIPATADSLWKY